jgi:bacterioferritin
MTTVTKPRSEERANDRKATTIELLTRAYMMEIETVANYLAASVNLDGIGAQEVVRALQADIEEELEHARKLAWRLKQLDAVVPGPPAVKLVQDTLQPSPRQTDVGDVVRAVLEAENAAIDNYQRLILETDGLDWVTQDLAVSLMADEEAHRRLFKGFLQDMRGDCSPADTRSRDTSADRHNQRWRP